VAATASLAVVTLVGAPAAWGPLSTACASAATPTAGLVVDFGTVADVPGAPAPAVQQQCVRVGSGETGSQLLDDAGHVLRFDSSGLLCAIDGYPATGCGVATKNGFQYWSYWHGGRSWTYSTVGPDSYAVKAGGVEGWRFVEGADQADEGAPRAAASGPCPPSTPSTAPPTTVAPHAAASTPPATAGGTTAPSAGAARPSSGPSATTGKGSPGSTTRSSSGTSPSPSGTDAGAADRSGTKVTTGTASGRQLAAAAPHHDAGSPVPALVFGGAVVLLGVAAWVISRWRSTP
jgi:hypothetical protein